MWLRQSTAVTVKIGPFVDDTDGYTPENGLAITQGDVRLSKNGSDFAQKDDVSSATNDENGWYNCRLNTADTNTTGRLVLAVYEAGALPVWHEYMVVTDNTYDSLVSGSDYLDTDVWEEVIESGAPTDARTARQMMRIIMSVLAGQTAGVGDWSALSLDETKTRVAGTLDASGNRTAITVLDGS